MQVERFQGSGAASAPEDGKLHSAFGELPRLGVQLHPLWVLDAVEVAALRAPDLLHAGAVNQGDAHGVRHVPEGVQHLLEEPLRLRCPPVAAPAVTGELLG